MWLVYKCSQDLYLPLSVSIPNATASACSGIPVSLIFSIHPTVAFFIYLFIFFIFIISLYNISAGPTSVLLQHNILPS